MKHFPRKKHIFIQFFPLPQCCWRPFPPPPSGLSWSKCFCPSRPGRAHRNSRSPAAPSQWLSANRGRPGSKLSKKNFYIFSLKKSFWNITWKINSRRRTHHLVQSVVQITLDEVLGEKGEHNHQGLGEQQKAQNGGVNGQKARVLAQGTHTPWKIYQFY